MATDDERLKALKAANLEIAKKLRLDWQKKYQHMGHQGKSTFQTATRYKERTPHQVRSGEGAWGGAPGESFKDFSQRRHDEMYPDAQRMANLAGVGGYKAFGPAHTAYQNQMRGVMGKAPGERYTSRDWRSYLDELRAKMGIRVY